MKEEQAGKSEVVEWATAVRKLYEDAQTWLREHPTPTVKERRCQYETLVS